MISCSAVLFKLKDFSPKSFPLSTLWLQWNQWDALQFQHIADYGYNYRHTAFFPLYPLLMRFGKLFTHNNGLLSGMVIANLAGLVMLIVLYQLVYEEFGKEQAQRTVLYLSIFPAAFFFMAAYNESLFLCFVLMFFYLMRHERWCLAGICGFFAVLTRSAGILLMVPFVYEYLRQRQFQLRKIRVNIISLLSMLGALIAYACYCYYRVGSFLAFSESQQAWGRYLAFPGYNLWLAFKAIFHSSGFLSFVALRTWMDIIPDVFVFVLLLCALVGPWRFRRSQMVYVLYGMLVFIYAQLYPVISSGNPMALEALSRYLLEVFPAFIVLGIMGRNRMVNQGYSLVACALFFFLLTQFLLGHWVI